MARSTREIPGQEPGRLLAKSNTTETASPSLFHWEKMCPLPVCLENRGQEPDGVCSRASGHDWRHMRNWPTHGGCDCKFSLANTKKLSSPKSLWSLWSLITVPIFQSAIPRCPYFKPKVIFKTQVIFNSPLIFCPINYRWKQAFFFSVYFLLAIKNAAELLMARWLHLSMQETWDDPDRKMHADNGPQQTGRENRVTTKPACLNTMLT